MPNSTAFGAAADSVSLSSDQCFWFSPPAPALEGAYRLRNTDSGTEWYQPPTNDGESRTIVDDTALITWLDNQSTVVDSNGIQIDKIVCPIDIPATAAPSSIQCYNMEVPVGEPTSKPNNAANKGYIKQRFWQIAQFVNEGNISNIDSDFHSIVEYDVDGLPVVSGDIVESNVTTMTRSEAAGNGELLVWEGYLYNPIRYPDTPAGKYIKKFEIVDTYTTTTYADFEQIYLAIDSNGKYTLDRDDLSSNLVLSAPAAGSFPAFELDPSQRGQYVRFYIAHGDKGGGSQVNWQVRITYADNTTQTASITIFLHQADVAIAYHAETQLVPHTYDTEAGEWSSNGSVVAVDTSLGNLQQAPCGELPITFTPYLAGDVFTISGIVGGSGTGYEYSRDGGRTWQSSPIFNLFGAGSSEIIPMVRDSNGTRSAKSGLTSYVNCVNSSWAADIAGAPNLSGEYAIGSGSGWFSTFSHQVGINLEQSNSGLSWTLIDATNNTSYLYLGSGFTSNEASADADLAPVLSAAVAGQEYTIALNPYSVSYGYAYGIATLQIEVVDKVTNAVLGAYVRRFYSGSNISLTNEKFTFLGSGNPVELKVNSSVSPLTPINGFFGDIGSLDIDSITTSGYIKREGAGWTTDIVSDKGRLLSDGVNVKFQSTQANQNIGMHGLNASGSNNNYSAIDYALYMTGGSVGIYENGVSKGSFGAYTDTDAFEINITSSGVATYLKNGSVFYTSLISATNPLYYYAGSPYAAGHGITGYSFNGDKVIHSGDWFGTSPYWIEQDGGIRKTLTTSGWNTQVVSTTMKAVSGSPTLAFSSAHASNSGINDGMCGLSGDAPGASYASIDYALYLSGTNVSVYEKGANRGVKSTSYTTSSVFSVEIDPVTKVVTYKQDGSTIYVSAVIADQDYYFIQVSPNVGGSNTNSTIGGGITDVVFNGDVDFSLPDTAGHYIRIDLLRLFRGKYQDGTHYAYKTGTYYFVRNIQTTDVVTFDAHVHSISDDVMVIPKFDIRPYGTPLAGDSVEMQSRVNSGPWSTLHKEVGAFNVANERDLQEFEYLRGVDISAGDSIQYRVIFNMDPIDTNRGYYVYSVSDYVKCS
ncbi:MAG: hypothetical protein GKR96_04190 [Gammaproteobacteria bacterium]|nr:hypothetical protein [Gammaproteobacteria bacterium]